MASKTIAECCDVLGQSERGRIVGGLVRELLDGPGCSLDQNGQMAVMNLLDWFWFRGSRSDVLESLRADFSTRKEW